MDIEFGNADALYTNNSGWFVGFSDWTKANIPGMTDLRFMEQEAIAKTIHMKWMAHPTDDPRGTAKPPSAGRTISILVSESGSFRLDFAENDQFVDGQIETHTLSTHGDFVIWGENIHHRWSVPDACTILTVRWIPVQPAD